MPSDTIASKDAPLLLTIDGLPSTGRSTLAQGLKERFSKDREEKRELHIYDVGLFYRAVAAILLETIQEPERVTSDQMLHAIDQFYYQPNNRDKPLVSGKPVNDIQSPQLNLWNAEYQLEQSHKGVGVKEFRRRFYSEDVDHITEKMTHEPRVKEAMRHFGTELIEGITNAGKDGIIIVGRTAGMRHKDVADARILTVADSRAVATQTVETARSGKERDVEDGSLRDLFRQTPYALKEQGYIVAEIGGRHRDNIAGMVNTTYHAIRSKLREQDVAQPQAKAVDADGCDLQGVASCETNASVSLL